MARCLSVNDKASTEETPTRKSAGRCYAAKAVSKAERGGRRSMSSQTGNVHTDQVWCGKLAAFGTAILLYTHTETKYDDVHKHQLYDVAAGERGLPEERRRMIVGTLMPYAHGTR